MLSWQNQYELWQDLATDSDSTNLTMGKKFINIGQRTLEKKLKIVTEDTRNYVLQTDAISGTSNIGYRLPENYGKFLRAYATVGDNHYSAHLIQDPGLWRRIRFTDTATSSFLQYIHIRRGSLDRFEIYPPPSTTDTLTFDYIAKGKDLSVDDYTTSTVTVTNGSTTVTGSGTTFTSAMAGRYFQVTNDEYWYKIATFTSTTVLVLAGEYQGLTEAGASYTIGQMPITPEDTHILPVYYALWKYYLFRKDRTMAREYRREWLNGLEEAIKDYANEEDSEVTYSDRAVVQRGVINPNDYPSGMT
jgi:hypothetical protein